MKNRHGAHNLPCLVTNDDSWHGSWIISKIFTEILIDFISVLLMHQELDHELDNDLQFQNEHENCTRHIYDVKNSLDCDQMILLWCFVPLQMPLKAPCQAPWYNSISMMYNFKDLHFLSLTKNLILVLCSSLRFRVVTNEHGHKNQYWSWWYNCYLTCWVRKLTAYYDS